MQSPILIEPEKGTCQGTMKRKDAASPKPAKKQEAAGSSEPESSGQRRSQRQAAAQPAIIDVEGSAGETEESGMQGKCTWEGKVANQVSQHPFLNGKPWR